MSFLEGREKSRGRWKKRQPTDLQHEGREVEGVIVHQDPANVAEDGVHDADEHADHEPPLLPAKTEVRVDNSRDRVQGDESEVGRKRGPIAVHGVLHWTEVERAVGLGSKIHHMWREARKPARVAGRHGSNIAGDLRQRAEKSVV